MIVIRSKGSQSARMIKKTHWIELKKSHVTLSLVEARHVGRLQPPDALDWDSSNCKIRGPNQYH